MPPTKSRARARATGPLLPASQLRSRRDFNLSTYSSSLSAYRAAHCQQWQSLLHSKGALEWPNQTRERHPLSLTFCTSLPLVYSTSLRYEAALTTALSSFRTLLASSNSKSWKPLASSSSASLDATATGSGSSAAKGKAKELHNGFGPVEQNQVQVHKKQDKKLGVDVVRAVTEIPVGDGLDLESAKAVLQINEVRGACERPPSLRGLIAEADNAAHPFRRGQAR